MPAIETKSRAKDRRDRWEWVASLLSSSAHWWCTPVTFKAVDHQMDMGPSDCLRPSVDITKTSTPMLRHTQMQFEIGLGDPKI